MKALGKGSVASIVKVGLQVVSAIVWVGIGATTLAALAAAAVGFGLAFGWIAPFAFDEVVVSAQGVNMAGEGPGLMSWPLTAASVLAALVALVGALIIVDRLQRLFANFTSNEPFNRANADHLRVIWIVMLGLELSKYAIALLFGLTLALFGRPEGITVNIEPEIDLSTWASILVLIVLAEVFREGARMREDQDLTI